MVRSFVEKLRGDPRNLYLVPKERGDITCFWIMICVWLRIRLHIFIMIYGHEGSRVVTISISYIRLPATVRLDRSHSWQHERQEPRTREERKENSNDAKGEFKCLSVYYSRHNMQRQEYKRSISICNKKNRFSEQKMWTHLIWVAPSDIRHSYGEIYH